MSGGYGKHAELAAELERRRRERMAKLSALWSDGQRRASFRDPTDAIDPKADQPKRKKKGNGK